MDNFPFPQKCVVYVLFCPFQLIFHLPGHLKTGKLNPAKCRKNPRDHTFHPHTTAILSIPDAHPSTTAPLLLSASLAHNAGIGNGGARNTHAIPPISGRYREQIPILIARIGAEKPQEVALRPSRIVYMQKPLTLP